jgi:ribosome-binding ATPase YchF (GTP1/OBG family)
MSELNMTTDRKESKMGEEHMILSERLEDQLRAVEWAKAEQKRLQKEKGDRISKELMEKMTPIILSRNAAKEEAKNTNVGSEKY